MAKTPYKLRVRKVRGDWLIDMMVPAGRGGFTVVETINRGPGTMRDAIAGLQEADLSAAPRLAAALVPIVT